jgi:hypothetical protein
MTYAHTLEGQSEASITRNINAEIDRELIKLACKYEGFEPEEITAPLLEAHGWTRMAFEGRPGSGGFAWHGDVVMTYETIYPTLATAFTPDPKLEIKIATYEPGEYSRIYGRKV